MENQDYTLAYSPCPNDTFLFYNLIHKELFPFGRVKEELHDVEVLNQSAASGKYDFTKLSYFAIFHLLDKYRLLYSGSALGRGCGPLIVKKKGKSTGDLKNQKILVPGLWTTANLLLHTYLDSRLEPVPVRYDLIMGKILSGEYDYGVIIHEERFTFEDRGLEKVEDLGDFWEGLTGLPIPLGAIAAKNTLNRDLQMSFSSTLAKSLEMAYANPGEARSYIIENAQEKDETVVQKHIDLYVNQFTADIGEEGKRAVETLYDKALSLGLVKTKTKELFI